MWGEQDTTGRVDSTGERLARSAAARWTRRSFMARAGRLAVLVAGGPALVSLLSDRAEARVCGQSGVAPKCPTYDCGADGYGGSWGWCWYAAGCCADGRLKKICDCCAPNTPHPRGYCPAGTRVYCIVESCDADPRVMPRSLTRIPSDDPVAVAVGASQHRFPSGAPIAVLGDAAEVEWAALASSLGRVVAGPVLLTSRGGLDAAVADELRRLRCEFVKLVGPRLAPEVTRGLRDLDIDVEVVGDDRDLATCSAEVASWHRAMTGGRTAIVVHRDVPHEAIAAAGALAHARRVPLLFGDGDAVDAALREPRPVTRTFVVSGDPLAPAPYPGPVTVSGAGTDALCTALADTAVGLGAGPDLVTLAPTGAPMTAAGAATIPAPLLRYRPGGSVVDHDWLLRHRHGITTAYVAGSPGVFTENSRYHLQSSLNEFEAHLLRGQPGQGLPVIPQPIDERPVGRARR